MPMLLVGRAADISVPYTDSEVRSLRSVLESRSPRGGGGGGGARGGGGSVSSGGGKASTGSSGSSGSSSGGGVRSSTPGFTAGSVSQGGALRGSSSATGVRTPYSITSGAFVGRTAGGGTRSNVYSGGGYGSGYPSRAGAGSTAGLGFPFIFLPLGFGALGGAGYYGSQEYRRSDRPGGEETTWILQPPAGVNADGNTFFLLGDTNSVNDVKNGLASACGSGTGNGTTPAGFAPLPTAVVQYYRASSFALGLAGYNNGQPLNSTDEAALNAPFTALPSSVNQTYFNCLNSTTGAQVPLVSQTDGALSSLGGANMLLMAPALLVAVFLGVA